MFPVEVFYILKPVKDYVHEAVDTVVQIHRLEGPGDILVFLTGEEEIETACASIIQHKIKKRRVAHGLWEMRVRVSRCGWGGERGEEWGHGDTTSPAKRRVMDGMRGKCVCQ